MGSDDPCRVDVRTWTREGLPVSANGRGCWATPDCGRDVPPGDGDTERDEDARAAVARRLNPLTPIVWGDAALRTVSSVGRPGHRS